MKKPQELRNYLLNCIPEIKNDPDQLQIFIDAGSLQTRLQASLHFEYQYTLNIILTDMAIHTDNVLVPLLAWLKAAQIDLKDDAIQFEADIIDHKKVDLSITVPLTERVLVTKNEDGNYTTDHPAEPVPEYNLPDPDLFKELYLGGEIVTETSE